MEPKFYIRKENATFKMIIGKAEKFIPLFYSIFSTDGNSQMLLRAGQIGK